MLPKGAMNRPSWANPKSRALTIVGLSVFISAALSVISKSYIGVVAVILLPLISYLISEQKEVNRLMKIDKNTTNSDKKIFQGIVRNRE